MDQLGFFLPILVQAFHLQFLPVEFVPFLYLQVRVELSQLHRRQMKLPKTEATRDKLLCDRHGQQTWGRSECAGLEVADRHTRISKTEALGQEPS